MNKRILLLVVIVLLCCGCSSAYDHSDTAQQDSKVNSDFSDTAQQDSKVNSDFIHIENYNSENLYYCKQTKIVYWIGGSYSVNVLGDDYTTSYMTAFYAPNGLPYRYDVVNNKLVEIE